MFGDNKSVVDSSMHPHAKLHKCHTLLSFHRVRQAIAHNVFSFFHIDGKINLADILSKHWSHNDVCTMLQPLMFWRGDTSVLLSTTYTEEQINNNILLVIKNDIHIDVGQSSKHFDFTKLSS